MNPATRPWLDPYRGRGAADRREPARFSNSPGPSEPEMELEVQTRWEVGGPIVLRGLHHARFENRGTVLCHEPAKLLRYSHLSSLSRLPDLPDSYSIFEFRLEPAGTGTALTVRISGFPTESIFKHLAFYWRGTLSALKRVVEGTERWTAPVTFAG